MTKTIKTIIDASSSLKGQHISEDELNLPELAKLHPLPLTSTEGSKKTLTFATVSGPAAVALLRLNGSGVAFVPGDWNAKMESCTIIRVDDPKLTFVKMLQLRLVPEVHIGMGENVHIDKTATIGGPGFGYVRDTDDRLIHFPHMGNVVLCDDVEIYPHANVDRGALADTIIGGGTKIDHHAHVAHNCVVGHDTMICAHAVLCGSSKVGDRCFIGVGALIKEAVTIGNDVIVGLGAVVIRDVPSGEIVVGNPARTLTKG